MFTELIIELSRFNFWVSSAPYPQDLDYGIDSDYTENGGSNFENKVAEEAKENVRTETTEPVKADEKPDDAAWLKKRREIVENVTVYYPCDKKSNLYVLQRKFSQEKIRYALSVPTNGSR